MVGSGHELISSRIVLLAVWGLGSRVRDRRGSAAAAAAVGGGGKGGEEEEEEATEAADAPDGLATAALDA